MNPHPSRSYDLLWLSIALLILLPIAFFLSITPHDYWFYVRIGRDILESGVIPRVDTFSYTFPGRPIFYQPWLSAVIFWWAHSLGGCLEPQIGSRARGQKAGQTGRDDDPTPSDSGKCRQHS